MERIEISREMLVERESNLLLYLKEARKQKDALKEYQETSKLF